MQKKFIKVRDLFSEDFFIRLKDFIFEESFEVFFNRRIKEIKTYAGYDESLWYPIEEDMKTSDIYPISFNDFLKMYDNVGACTSFVDKSLFCIKFLIKELFENQKSEFLNNENFSIKLNKNVILNQYDKVFDSNFLEIKLSYLDRYLGIFSNNEKSIDLCARNIIFFCLNYIQGYLENIVENILVDNNILINAYDSETKYNLSLNKKNRTKEKNSLIKNFINTSKEIRNSRFKLMSGKSKIEILGHFPRNYECLEKEIKRIKKEYDNHEYIKSQLRKIKKGVNIEEIRQNIYDYMKNQNDEEIYLTEKGEFIARNCKGIIDKLSPELIHTIDNYIKLASQEDYNQEGCFICSISDVIRYTLLEISGDLKYIESENDILKVINTFFKRRKTQKHFYVFNEISPVYKLNSFKEKYIQFFKY